MDEKPVYPKSDFDLLADVAWFIKGMIAAGNDTFNQSHLRAMEDIRDAVKKHYTIKDVVQ